MISNFEIDFVKYNPRLSESLGRGGAMFVNALQFLLNNQSIGKQQDGKKWVYNTIEQWAKSLKYSNRQIQRIVNTLRDQQIIFVKKLSHSKGNSTNYYTLNQERVGVVLQGDVSSLKVPFKPRNVEQVSEQDNPKKASDKMSLALGHNGSLYTKKTNKEINNKSEEKINISVPPSEIIVPINFTSEMNQVQQVKINKSDLKKENAGADTVCESHHSPKTTVAQDMLAVWNHTFEKNQASMSKQLAPLLVAAYKHKFDSDIEKWKHYCLTLASSPYLTGKKFNLSLLWALKYATIDRVNNHEFGVKEMITSTYSKADALIHIENVKEPEICKEVRGKLLTAYGEKVYKDWFEELHFELIGNEICFKAKNNFINDYVKSKFGDLFSKRAD